ncbi:hypothetical protein JT306_19125 [Salmonella enterica subsp. enterica serovar Kentucky]|nr:hypothetical protein [Salmonella enterica subsp. enterica serovar Kentucky]
MGSTATEMFGGSARTCFPCAGDSQNHQSRWRACQRKRDVQTPAKWPA